MPELSLALYAVYLGLAFGVRTVIQLRRTVSSGFHGVGGRPGSAEWLAGVGFVVALLLGAVAPVLVTDVPFALVRNPIFSAMIPTALGLVLPPVTATG